MSTIRRRAPGVVLINEAMAKQYLPKGDPRGPADLIIGKGMGPEFEEPARQIIGIVGNTHEGGLARDPGPMMIIPDAQVTDGMTKLNAGIVPLRWVVRTHGDPHQLTSQITEQLRHGQRRLSGGARADHGRGRGSRRPRARASTCCC